MSDRWKKGADFLGVQHSIMGGAMSWVSESGLVSSIGKAGGFGVLACGSMSADLLDAEIRATKAKFLGPFGVNLITMHPDIDKLLNVCLDNGVKHIVFAGAIPSKSMISSAKLGNAKVMAFAPSASLAKRMINSGVDGLIIEGMEAGGHIGPVSTSVLAQQILPHFKDTDVPVFVAGGIGTGQAMAGYVCMGASGCQIGTLFACCKESIAHENFKNICIKASSKDAVSSVQLSNDFPVIPVRAIRNDATLRFVDFQKDIIARYERGEISKDAGMLEVEKYWAGALKKAVIDGDVVNGSLMAGQSVGMVNNIESAGFIINRLLDEAKSFFSIRSSIIFSSEISQKIPVEVY